MDHLFLGPYDILFISLLFLSSIPLFFLAGKLADFRGLSRHYLFAFFLIINIFANEYVHFSWSEDIGDFYLDFKFGLLLTIFFYLTLVSLFYFLKYISANRQRFWKHLILFLTIVVGFPYYIYSLDPANTDLGTTVFVVVSCFFFYLTILLTIAVLRFVKKFIYHLILSDLHVSRSGSVVTFTLSGKWLKTYKQYLKFVFTLSWFYWVKVFPHLIKLTKYWPFSKLFLGSVKHYEHRKESAMLDRIRKVSKKLHNPVTAYNIVETDLFTVYPCEIVTKSKKPWQSQFEKLLSKELGTNNFFIRPGAFFENTIDVMIPKE